MSKKKLLQQQPEVIQRYIRLQPDFRFLSSKKENPPKRVENSRDMEGRCSQASQKGLTWA